MWIMTILRMIILCSLLGCMYLTESNATVPHFYKHDRTFYLMSCIILPLK